MAADSQAERYRAMVEAVAEQEARLRAPNTGAERWDRAAARFRLDPHRSLDPELTEIAGFLAPDDVLVDVGGGAGRVSLPLALRCREVINVEPSAGMAAQFGESAAEAGITNARVVQAAWGDAPDVAGDVCFVANVTYFVPDIVSFIEKLHRSARRRVVIMAWSVPPPNREAAIFEVATGEPLARYPGCKELVPVLWEMGLFPDVRMLRDGFRPLGKPPATQGEAIEGWLRDARLRDEAAARTRLEAAFDSLYTRVGEGFRPIPPTGMRQGLITWTTGAD